MVIETSSLQVASQPAPDASKIESQSPTDVIQPQEKARPLRSAGPCSVQTEPVTLVPYSVIEQDLKKKAYQLGAERKFRIVTDKIKELRGIAADLGRIHSKMTSSDAERLEDWRLALTYFAADVLAGRTDLIQLDDRSWSELERVGLEEVKRLNAFHYSLTDAHGRDTVGCYLAACDELRVAMLNPDMKFAAADFDVIRNFLLSNRGCGESFLRAGNDAAEALKASKAIVLCEQRRIRSRDVLSHSEAEDWYKASEYVDLFYGNVLDAVEGSDTKIKRSKMKMGLSAFRNPWRDSGLVNCFEAAIAIYFFDPELVKKCCVDENDLL